VGEHDPVVRFLQKAAAISELLSIASSKRFPTRFSSTPLISITVVVPERCAEHIKDLPGAAAGIVSLAMRSDPLRGE